MSIVDRIKAIKDAEGLSMTTFENKIEISQGYLSTLEKKGRTPGVEIILTVVDKFPEYSLDWILTGKGQMKKLEKVNTKEKPHSIEDAIAQSIIEKIIPILEDKSGMISEQLLKMDIELSKIRKLEEDIKIKVNSLSERN